MTYARWIHETDRQIEVCEKIANLAQAEKYLNYCQKHGTI